MLPHDYLIVFINTDLTIIGIVKTTSFPHNPSFLVRKVCDVMTANCACVLGDLRVDEVLAMLKEKRIGEVPVIDADEKFIGMADLKGLVSL